MIKCISLTVRMWNVYELPFTIPKDIFKLISLVLNSLLFPCIEDVLRAILRCLRVLQDLHGESPIKLVVASGSYHSKS